MAKTPDFDAVLEQLGLADPKPAAPNESDVPLMDLVQAFTFDTEFISARAGGQREPYSPKVKNVLQSYRIKLRQAERFVLDEPATRLVCHLSHELDRLAAWSFLARLPYPVFWVEFDNFARMDEFMKMGKTRPDLKVEQSANRLGFLFYKESGSDTRWIAQEFIQVDDKALPSFLSFIFDPVGDVKYPLRRSSTWNMPTLSMRKGFPKIPMNIGLVGDGKPIAVTYADAEFAICGLLQPKHRNPDGSVTVPAISAIRSGEASIADASDILVSPDWFSAKTAVIVDPFWHYHYESHPDLLNRAVASHVIEESGMLRYLITLLASINALPRAVRPIHTRAGSQRVGLTHHVPWMQHRNLTLEIPRDNRTVWAKKQLDHNSLGRKLAWHSVRGHWRIIEYGKGQGRMCRHMPAILDESDPDVGICENCEMLIRWIELPDGRGDINLGVVDKTYKVKKRKGG